MLSPEEFKADLKSKSYNQLIVERNSLIGEIYDFENDEYSGFSDVLLYQTSPEETYHMNLKYLSLLTEYMSERFGADHYLDGKIV